MMTAPLIFLVSQMTSVARAAPVSATTQIDSRIDAAVHRILGEQQPSAIVEMRQLDVEANNKMDWLIATRDQDSYGGWLIVLDDTFNLRSCVHLPLGWGGFDTVGWLRKDLPPVLCWRHDCAGSAGSCAWTFLQW